MIFGSRAGEHTILSEYAAWKNYLQKDHCIFGFSNLDIPSQYFRDLIYAHTLIEPKLKKPHQMDPMSFRRELEKQIPNSKTIVLGLLCMLIRYSDQKATYSILKNFGYEYMKIFLVQYQIFHEKGFHKLNNKKPEYFQNVARIFGYIIQDMNDFQTFGECLFVVLRNVSQINETEYKKYGEPLMFEIASNINKFNEIVQPTNIAQNDLLAMIFVRIVLLLNSDIFSLDRKEQKGPRIYSLQTDIQDANKPTTLRDFCCLLEKIWAKQKQGLAILGIGRELYLYLGPLLISLESNSLKYLSNIQKDLEELVDHKDMKVPFYYLILINQTLDKKLYNITQRLALSAVLEIQVQFMASQLCYFAIGIQMSYLLDVKNEGSLWFLQSLVRYIVCVLDYEEIKVKAFKIGQLLFVITSEITKPVDDVAILRKKQLERTRDIKFLKVKASTFFDWPFAVRDQDNHQILSGIYLLEYIIKANPPNFGSLWVDIIRFVLSLYPNQPSSFRESVKESLIYSFSQWVHFVDLAKKCLPDNVLTELSPYVDLNKEFKPEVYEDESKQVQNISDLLYMPSIGDQSEEVYNQQQMEMEQEEMKGELPVYRQLWLRTQNYLKRMFDNPNDNSALKELVQHIEKNPPKQIDPSDQIPLIITEELVKIYYTLYHSHLEHNIDSDPLRKWSWNFITIIIQELSLIRQQEHFHSEVIKLLCRYDIRVKLTIFGLACTPNMNDDMRQLCGLYIQDLSPQILYDFFASTDQQKYERQIENFLKTKNANLILGNVKNFQTILMQFNQYDSLKEILKSQNIQVGVMIDLLKTTLYFQPKVQAKIFSLYEAYFSKYIIILFTRLSIEKRAEFATLSFDALVIEINKQQQTDFQTFWSSYTDLIKQTFVKQLNQAQQAQFYTNIVKLNCSQAQYIVPLVISIYNNDKEILIKQTSNFYQNNKKEQNNVIEILKVWAKESSLRLLMENIKKDPQFIQMTFLQTI